MTERKASPEENEAINKNVASMISDLEKVGLKPDAVLAFVSFPSGDYNVSTMLNGYECEGDDVEEAIDDFTHYVHEEIGDQLAGADTRSVLPDGRRTAGFMMDGAVTESMGWKERLESLRRIPRDGIDKVMLGPRVLEDLFAALDHIKKLEAGIKECEGDGGCRATKFVKESESQRPPPN